MTENKGQNVARDGKSLQQYQNKGLAVSYGRELNHAQNGCQSRRGMGGALAMVTLGIRISKDIYMERSDYEVERLLEESDLAD
jgi:hypothetical protein